MAGSAVATALAAVACVRQVTPVGIHVSASGGPADGVTLLEVVTTPADATVEIVEGRHLGTVHRHTLRIGVTPGRIRLRAQAPGHLPGFATVATVLDEDDRNADGTPDFLRLGLADREAFRQWFTFLAESQFFRHGLPTEINDCAALIRYGYREALMQHDSAWAARAALPLVPTLPDVRKYSYPFTPLEANLFRIRAGAFDAFDLTDGAFAQFADAQTLQRFNTHFVSRSLDAARPGDLLFFRQVGGTLPFHSMVWIGRSHFEASREDYVVYHTGPIDSHAGEVRRLTVSQLLHHPEPRWRPLEGNSNFLGVYRWNIL
ncbi:MAG TPA: DUF1175 domain-containing protein [Bryobacteraceae bacterium]|nr:DUF1175 domain-containing protein [Bryobacteraceae bacterium]